MVLFHGGVCASRMVPGLLEEVALTMSCNGCARVQHNHRNPMTGIHGVKYMHLSFTQF